MTALTRWHPFEDLFRAWPTEFFGRDLFGPVGRAGAEWNPRCDVTEKDDAIVIHAELPGVAAKDMEMTVREGVLTIRGEKRSETTEEEKGRKYQERFFGSFERALALPKNIDESAIKAELKDGVLEVRLPKAKVTEPETKTIPIAGP